MKRNILLILLVVTCFSLGYSLLYGQDYDIRKLKWGMPYSEVRKIEGLGTSLYKEESLLDIKVEVLFGCDNKGLHSVVYSTREKEFYDKAHNVLKEKYGEPGKDFDYAFLMQSKFILEENSDAAVQLYEKDNLDSLSYIKSTEAKMILQVGLARRQCWTTNNTVILLLKSSEGVVLGYRSKTSYEDNKAKFLAFFQELKKKSTKIKEDSDEEDKF